MSNLKGYQTMTTAAKKVGGPRNLLLITLVGGGIVYKIAETGVKIIARKFKSIDTGESDFQTYVVHTEYNNNQDLILCVGDEYKVLATDGDAALIEITNNDNNPYFLSTEVLKQISNYDN